MTKPACAKATRNNTELRSQIGNGIHTNKDVRNPTKKYGHINQNEENLTQDEI